MKNIILATLMVIGLSGCATHRQSNELAGAAVGGIIGNAIGGKGGAAVGAVIGAGIGGNQPTSPQEQIYYQPPPNVVYVPPYYNRPSVEYIWVYTPRYGWGWYHPHHRHFHHRHYRKH